MARQKTYLVRYSKKRGLSRVGGWINLRAKNFEHLKQKAKQKKLRLEKVKVWVKTKGQKSHTRTLR